MNMRLVKAFLPWRSGWTAMVGHSVTAYRRSFGNWVLPAILSTIFFVLLVLYHGMTFNSDGFGFLVGRIILFDYLIFVLGWLGGWVAAFGWRRNHVFVEEVVLTPIRPGEAARTFIEGPLAIWSLFMVAVALLDIAFECIVFWVGVRDELRTNPGYNFIGPLLLYLAVIIPGYACIAWFHLLSLRIAFWMFASAALPRFQLINTAVTNFFAIPFYVVLLTTVGSFVTGVIAMIIGVTIEIISARPWSPGPQNGLIESGNFWLFAAIPGLILVGWLKVQIMNVYEVHFWRAWLHLTWWGAGERQQPKNYPMSFRVRSNQWITYYRRIGAESIPPPEGRNGP